MLRTKRKRHKVEKEGWYGMKGALKHHSNRLNRSRAKKELHLIKKYEDYEFNFTYKYVYMLQWVYD